MDFRLPLPPASRTTTAFISARTEQSRRPPIMPEESWAESATAVTSSSVRRSNRRRPLPRNSKPSAVPEKKSPSPSKDATIRSSCQERLLWSRAMAALTLADALLMAAFQSWKTYTKSGNRTQWENRKKFLNFEFLPAFYQTPCLVMRMQFGVSTFIGRPFCTSTFFS